MADQPASHRWSAQELLDLVLDADSFESWDEPIDISDAPPGYRAALEAARAKAGTDESVLTGRGLVRGRPVAVVANEFRFLAGSIGLAAARRITTAVRRATAEGLPVLATTASGGTRMQEGTPAFVQMVEISRALMEHRAAGLPYLAYLRHPTTGGVYASWGSLAHVTVGEPGALIGFLGPKVFEALNGRPFPAGVQVAENLSHHGVIDGIATAEELPGAGRRGAGDPRRPAIRAAAAAAQWRAGPRPRRLGGDPGDPRARTGSACATSCATAPRCCCRSRGPRRASGTAPCWWSWPGSTASPAWSSARTGAGRAPPRRWGRAPCGRRGARCGWPTRCGCRWSP